MKEIVTYLTFDGTCRDAMKFYEKSLGGKLEMMTFADAKQDVPGAKDRIMHAKLIVGNAATIMASDNMPGHDFVKGTNFSISIQCESLAEIEKLFKAIGEKGTVTMALENTFWGARFGMLKDQFGINWMFNLDLPKS